MMNFITQEQLNLFQTFVNFPSFQRRKRKKPRGKFWFINLLQKLVFYKTMLTKKSERETDCFAKVLNPDWEGVKSIPKTGQSLPINGSAMRADL